MRNLGEGREFQENERQCDTLRHTYTQKRNH